MKYFASAVLLFIFYGCRNADHLPVTGKTSGEISSTVARDTLLYDALKDSIISKRQVLFRKYFPVAGGTDEITAFWVDQIGNHLFNCWQYTRWDFNGTASRPHQGAIACGYFVTTLLRDMGYTLNRSKLAICPSSVMMKTLTPHQKLRNLSYLTYPAFDDEITKSGKGVYIIGLDYHTGFIVNDGIENWFIHSNYMYKVGVVKERLSGSSNLRASKTRWVTCLTDDRDFINKWLKGY